MVATKRSQENLETGFTKQTKRTAFIQKEPIFKHVLRGPTGPSQLLGGPARPWLPLTLIKPSALLCKGAPGVKAYDISYMIIPNLSNSETVPISKLIREKIYNIENFLRLQLYLKLQCILPASKPQKE